MPLAPKLVMAETRGVYAGPVTITVLIPAHNEESCISETLASLLSQSLPPARVVVVADNCTDATVRLAREARRRRLRDGRQRAQEGRRPQPGADGDPARLRATTTASW